MRNNLLITLMFSFFSFSAFSQSSPEDIERYTNECRDEGHLEIRRKIKLNDRGGGPENESEREAIIMDLYKKKNLYLSQTSSRNGFEIPAPDPLGTEYEYADGRLKGSWQINKVNHNADGARLDRTTYDVKRNHIYAINTTGNLVDGPLVAGGELKRRNQTIILSKVAFTGVENENNKFRLIGGIKPRGWSAGSLFYSDNDGLSWSQCEGGDYTDSKLFYAEGMEDGTVIALLGRLGDGGIPYIYLLKSTDKGKSFTEIKSWKESSSNNIVAAKLYNTADHVVIVSKTNGKNECEINNYRNGKLETPIILTTNLRPVKITGAIVAGKPFIYLITSASGGFVTEDGLTFKSVPTLKSNIHTMSPTFPKVLISNEAKHDYSADGGVIWQEYPNNDQTIGWDPKHITYYKDAAGVWTLVAANDMGLHFHKQLNPIQNIGWSRVNTKHTHAILHGGAAHENGLVVTSNQDPGTYEGYTNAEGTIVATKRNGADGLRAVISNDGKAFWYRHYWETLYHSNASFTGDSRKTSIPVGPAGYVWYTPPMAASTEIGQDAVYFTGYDKLLFLEYTSVSNSITTTTLPFNFKTNAGDVVLGVGTCKGNPDRIYAATKNRRFYISDDKGETWTESKYGTSLRPSPNSIGYNQTSGFVIAPSNHDPNTVIWAGGSGPGAILISNDGGKNFRPMMNGMPLAESIGSISWDEEGKVVFSSNFKVYFTDQDAWHYMEDNSKPIGISSLGAYYLPKLKKVRYFTWGAGVLDFNVSKIISSLETPTKDINSLENKFKIYPNPSSTHFTIEALEDNQIGSKYELFDIIGKKITAGMITESRIILDVSRYNKGSYTLKLTNKEGVKTSKMVMIQ
jgi:hypothetical protein